MVRKGEKGTKGTNLYTRHETERMTNITRMALAGQIPTGAATVCVLAIQLKSDERREFCASSQMPQMSSPYLMAFESDKCSYTAPIDPYGANKRDMGRRDYCDVSVECPNGNKDLSWGGWQHPGRMVETS